MTAIDRLSLTNFRNYRDALVEPGAGFVLLTGPNGAGKTNVLEAVSLMTPGAGVEAGSGFGNCGEAMDLATSRSLQGSARARSSAQARLPKRPSPEGWHQWRGQL